MTTKTLYRYTKWCADEQLETASESNVKLTETAYTVIRETAAYYIVRANGSYGKEKRVSKNAHSPFAAPSKELALQHFIWRAESSIRINRHNIRYSELAIEFAKKMKEETK